MANNILYNCNLSVCNVLAHFQKSGYPEMAKIAPCHVAHFQNSFTFVTNLTSLD